MPLLLRAGEVGDEPFDHSDYNGDDRSVDGEDLGDSDLSEDNDSEDETPLTHRQREQLMGMGMPGGHPPWFGSHHNSFY